MLVHLVILQDGHQKIEDAHIFALVIVFYDGKSVLNDLRLEDVFHIFFGLGIFSIADVGE